MAARPWQTSLGIAAVLIWTTVIGFPVLVFHATDRAVLVGDHIHSAVLFVASQGLVFWLAARSTAPARLAAHGGQPAAPQGKSIPEPIWEAELAEHQPFERSQPRPASPFGEDVRRAAAPLTIGNYFASGNIRYVLIEPGGARYDLLPGQALQVFPNDSATDVRFRIVESEQSTHVCVEGVGIIAIDALLEKNSHHGDTMQSTRRGLAEEAS